MPAPSTTTPAGPSCGVWKAQHFSYLMTTMPHTLHTLPDTPFDVRRQIGEGTSVVESRAGATFLAEAYTGWPV